ncbi:MAG: TIGR03936 family radical SAM-associated protein [Acidobacteriota bacterium]|nr:TIGR03936 family radical SAM-associated protein [Acidobacteriota bacterium]
MTDRVRLRIRFSKLGKIRWTSHRDVARMWERAFRRVDLPLAYSEGFSPRPKVSFGLALSTGHESLAEFLDVELSGWDGVEWDGLPDRLSAALPVGIDVTAVAVLEPGTPSLQEAVTSCSWRFTVASAEGHPPVEEAEVRRRVAALMSASRFEVTRSRKGTEVTEDIRPGICSLEVQGGEPAGTVLTAELVAAPRAVRPAEVVTALGPGLEERDVRRTHQWIQCQDAPREPLLAAPEDAPVAPHALERAS